MDLIAQLTGTEFSPAQAAVWIAIAATVVGGGLLGLQRFRKALAEELRNELSRSQKAAEVRVENRPLDVREYQEMCPLSAHNDLRARFDAHRDETNERFEGFREEMNAKFLEASRASTESRGKIYDLLREQGNRLSDVAAHQAATSARVTQLDGKIDQVLLRLSKAS